MKRISLNGKWSFHEVGRGKWFDASVPGSNYSDLIHNDIIMHPYYDDNEGLVQWVGERDWEYVREFTLSQDMLKSPVILLECNSLDTIAEIYINDRLLAKTENAFQIYKFDIKNYVSRLTNKIRIKFRSPLAYIEKMMENTPLATNKIGLTGASYLRKPSNHFGWTNSPMIPLCGISGDISIVAYDEVRIAKTLIDQDYVEGFTNINCHIEILGKKLQDEENNYSILLEIVEPDGKVNSQTIENAEETNDIMTTIINPMYWTLYENLGEKKQNLYEVKISLFKNNDLIDFITKKIGLRRINVIREKDSYGRNFEILLNGQKVNIKGVIITDQDIISARTNKEKMNSLIDSIIGANMNMIRVFAGDGYQTEEFYNLCDEKGILVWQDMPFSSYEYPLENKDFRQNVAKEIACQMQRLYTHPSLCLVCGSYDIEHRAVYWKVLGKKVKDINAFFYDFVPNEIMKVSPDIAYLPGAPISIKFLYHVNSDRYGVSTLWDIWNGMRSIKKATNRTPRFCLEFGMPSVPSIKTMNEFSEKKKIYDINSEMLVAHQKMHGGIDRMLYYISTRFRVPKSMADLVYYSQLTQAEYYKEMTEHLRRNMRKCSGYIMSSANQCWPGIDYSMIDYLGNYKAVMYKAKHFNHPLIISIEKNKYNMKIHLVNDYDKMIKGSIKWYVETFDGEKVVIDDFDIEVAPQSSTKVGTINVKDYIKNNNKDRVFVAELYDEDYNLITREIKMFVPNKIAQLQDPNLSYELRVVKNVAHIKVRAEKYARYVKLTMDDTYMPFSDNYFDLLAGEEKEVTIPLKKEIVDKAKNSLATEIDSAITLNKKIEEIVLPLLSVKSVANVDQKGNVFRDIAKNVGVLASPRNIKDSIKHFIFK